MTSNQIVFLFDLEAFRDDLTKDHDDLSQKLLKLRLACLRILIYYSHAVPSLKWGFKFFDSNGSVTQTMFKSSFQNVDLESFEVLENEICLQYQRHASLLEALESATNLNHISSSDESSLTSNKLSTTPIQLLQLALNEVLNDFHWEETIELFSTKKKKLSLQSVHGNKLFLVTKCVSNKQLFHECFGVKFDSVDVSKLGKLIISPALRENFIEKASIQWVWLNSAHLQISDQPDPDVFSLLLNTLAFLQGIIIPLNILSQSKCSIKFGEDVQQECFGNTLLPFSALYGQICTNFLSSPQENVVKSYIYFHNHQLEISVFYTRIPSHWNVNKNKNNFIADHESMKSCINDESSSLLVWSKFTIYFSQPKHNNFNTQNLLICLTSKSENSFVFESLLKSLLVNDLSMFMLCESECGKISPAVLSPLSDSSALISFLTAEDYCLSAESVESCKLFHNSDFTDKNVTSGTDVLCEYNLKPASVKPFKMECLEKWFEPSKQNLKQSTWEEDTFHANLFESFKKIVSKLPKKDTKGLKNQAQQKKVSPEKVKEDEHLVEIILTGLNDEQVLLKLKDVYESSLSSGESVLVCAKKLIRVASSHFLQKSIIKYEEEMKKFMSEFLITIQALNKKYASNEDQNSSKMIKECQLQVLLILEMELLFPSIDDSTCISVVLSFLISMVHFSDLIELNKFLFDVLKENYYHKLHDVIVKIGDEFNIELEPEEDSPEDLNDCSSSQLNLFDSLASSPIKSYQSSSSTSDRSNYSFRNLVRKRSDISDARSCRQVLLPAKSPKKRKISKTSNPVKAVGQSASKKIAWKKNNHDTKSSNNKAKRNLFLKDKTPKTPKSHFAIETKFVVADTPYSKQDHSAFQRRKSQVDTSSSETNITEIAESPFVNKHVKDSATLRRLKELKENKFISSKASTSTGSEGRAQFNRFVPHTPERRRLSLKLFSKVMTSPTARRGFRKCIKRLFDPMSPTKQENTEHSNKKRRLSNLELSDNGSQM